LSQNTTKAKSKTII